MTISYVDRQALGVLADAVCDDLHIGDAAYGLLGSAFSIAYLVGAPAAGFLLDRLGVRRGLLASVVTWSVVAAGHALAPGFAVLFALRIALGLAEAPSFPGATQVVHRALPPEDRARGVGVLFTGSSLGAILAPLIAGAIFRASSWRMAFLGTAAVGLAWLPLWLFVTRGDDARAVLAVPHERPADAPRPLAVLAHPAVLRTMLPVIAAAPTMAFVLLFGAKFLVRTFHVEQAHVDRYLVAPPLLFDLGSVGFGFLAARFRRAQAEGDHRPPRLVFFAAAALATALFFAPRAAGPWEAVAIASVAATGVGGVFATAMGDLLGRVPRSVVSLAAGLSAAAQSVAYVVASPLIGRSVERTQGYALALVCLGAWAVPGCVAWLLWRPPARVD